MTFNNVKAQKVVDNFLIQVDGLGCPFCAYGLEKKFKEFKGIKKVSIQIETGDFRFTYPTEKKLTMEAIITQVKKAGYTPKEAKIIRANGEEELFSVSINEKAIERKDLKKANLQIAGNCQMCKARIEGAALSNIGVQHAMWNEKTKTLDFSFSENKTSVKEVARSIADQGHDSKVEIAGEEVYNALPVCCAYRTNNAQ